MQSLKRNPLDISVLGGIVLALGLSWGNPFASSANAQDQAEDLQQPRNLESTTLAGMIMRSGEQFVLRQASGVEFKLDDAQRARPYVGKTVKVTGRPDEQGKAIHVDNIEISEG